MILFLDTDVLLDFALDRKPFAQYAEKLIDLIQKGGVKTFIAWHSISNFYYLVNSKLDSELAKAFIKDLLHFVKIAKTSNEELLLAMKLDIKDFEDAMQISAALAARADYILTRNVKDFKNSPIPALSPENFLKLRLI